MTKPTKRQPPRCMEFLCPQADLCALYINPMKASPDTTELDPKIVKDKYGMIARCYSFFPKKEATHA